mmetsp:Transcript_19485/g.41518  ORF Transcript_19485/g.41518 Transcript_19485/m.41518 type:complete len:341 (-) Transcript_19485:589-1611(-)
MHQCGLICAPARLPQVHDILVWAASEAHFEAPLGASWAVLATLEEPHARRLPSLPSADGGRVLLRSRKEAHLVFVLSQLLCDAPGIQARVRQQILSVRVLRLLLKLLDLLTALLDLLLRSFVGLGGALHNRGQGSSRGCLPEELPPRPSHRVPEALPNAPKDAAALLVLFFLLRTPVLFVRWSACRPVLEILAHLEILAIFLSGLLCRGGGLLRAALAQGLARTLHPLRVLRDDLAFGRRLPATGLGCRRRSTISAGRCRRLPCAVHPLCVLRDNRTSFRGRAASPGLSARLRNRDLACPPNLAGSAGRGPHRRLIAGCRGSIGRLSALGLIVVGLAGCL